MPNYMGIEKGLETAFKTAQALQSSEQNFYNLINAEYERQEIKKAKQKVNAYERYVAINKDLNNKDYLKSLHETGQFDNVTKALQEEADQLKGLYGFETITDAQTNLTRMQNDAIAKGRADILNAKSEEEIDGIIENLNLEWKWTEPLLNKEYREMQEANNLQVMSQTIMQEEGQVIDNSQNRINEIREKGTGGEDNFVKDTFVKPKENGKVYDTPMPYESSKKSDFADEYFDPYLQNQREQLKQLDTQLSQIAPLSHDTYIQNVLNNTRKQWKANKVAKAEVELSNGGYEKTVKDLFNGLSFDYIKYFKGLDDKNKMLFYTDMIMNSSIDKDLKPLFIEKAPGLVKNLEIDSKTADTMSKTTTKPAKLLLDVVKIINNSNITEDTNAESFVNTIMDVLEQDKMGVLNGEYTNLFNYMLDVVEGAVSNEKAGAVKEALENRLKNINIKKGELANDFAEKSNPLKLKGLELGNEKAEQDIETGQVKLENLKNSNKEGNSNNGGEVAKGKYRIEKGQIVANDNSNTVYADKKTAEKIRQNAGVGSLDDILNALSVSGDATFLNALKNSGKTPEGKDARLKLYRLMWVAKNGNKNWYVYQNDTKITPEMIDEEFKEVMKGKEKVEKLSRTPWGMYLFLTDPQYDIKMKKEQASWYVYAILGEKKSPNVASRKKEEKSFEW